MSAIHSRWSLAIAALTATAICAAAALGVGSASADVSFDDSFGAAGQGSGQLANATGIAVNHSTGDVYVSDTGNQRVQQFDADGNFIRMWGLAVNVDSGGDICPRAGNPGDTCQAGTLGGVGGAFNSPRGIAVDNSGGPDDGSVYVVDSNNNRVQKFTAEGEFLRTWGKAVNLDTGLHLCTAASGDTCKPGNTSGVPGNPDVEPPIEPVFSEPGQFGGWQTGLVAAIATDSNGFVYVNDPYAVPQRVQKFAPDGSFVAQIAPDNNGAVTGFRDRGARGTMVATADGDVLVRDSTGDFAPAFKKFNASDFSLDGASASTDQVVAQFVDTKVAAFDPSNGFLLGQSGDDACTSGAPAAAHLREYAPSGQQVDCSIPISPSVDDAGGMVISTDHRLYVTVGDEVHIFTVPASAPPTVESDTPSGVTSKSAVINTQVAPKLSETEVRVEFGLQPCSANPCTESADTTDIGAALDPTPATVSIQGLAPDTTYYYRIIAENGEGATTGTDGVFKTFSTPTFSPNCANNLARQQTGAAFLLDCRAYELVSAEDQGGYDVESDLVEDQSPYAGFPQASDKALYTLHSGSIPNIGLPTNRGGDPYVATRDVENQRWVTEYVGIPANAPSTSPFSSTVTDADGGLGSFAFGGDDVCSPCFADDSVGIPIRTDDGTLEQGMKGSVPVSLPEPTPDAVKKHFSADGSTFIFASQQRFLPAGNDSNGHTTIYARNLDSESYRIVSRDENGLVIQNAADIAQLAVSEDGSHILFGLPNSTDAEGNVHYDLYMNRAGEQEALQITTGPSGGLYAGMSGDGSQVLFSTRDTYDGDTDTSVDLFRATVNGAVSVERVSSGDGAGDTDDCDPSATSYNSSDWNALPGGPTDCSVLAIGGGGGVASGSGAVYFLSPEQLDGNGAAGSPNIFVQQPGKDPKFVETLESSATTTLGDASPDLDKFFGSFTLPVGAAVDTQDGSVYVFDNGNGFLSPAGSVHKFDSSGDPDTTFGSGGVLSGFVTVGGGNVGQPAGFPAGIAVDNNPASPNYGDLYVADASRNLFRYSSLGILEDTTPLGGGTFDSGVSVAVDPTNGNVYVARSSLLGGNATIFVFDTDGDPIAPTSFSVTGVPFGLAIDSNGVLYVGNGTSALTYNAATGAAVGTLPAPNALGIGVDLKIIGDAGDDLVYVNRGNQIATFNTSGAVVGTPGTSTVLSGSAGIAAGAGLLVTANASSGNASFFGLATPSSRLYDHPLIIGSLRDAAAPQADQIQVSATGEHAVFASTRSFTGFDNAERYELFRFAVDGGQFACVSCDPTGAAPSTDARLTENGLSVTDDGRVFFTTGEPLVLRDTNNKADVYEWRDGVKELISTGQSPFNSSLLSATGDGRDVFFFTRETLAENDGNGTLVKLYTAREDGGFFTIPPEPPCAASDECHGPSSEVAPPIDLGTLKGTGGNYREPIRCNTRRLARGARRYANRAKALRRRAARAARAGNPRSVRRNRRRSRRFAGQARRRANAAKRCRAARQARRASR